MWYQDRHGMAFQLMGIHKIYWEYSYKMEQRQIKADMVLRNGDLKTITLEIIDINTEGSSEEFIEWIVSHFFDLHKRPLKWRHYLEWRKEKQKETKEDKSNKKI